MHILVNRVHPETGIAATLSNSKLKLSQWAQEYEQKQGQIVCPQRVENNARRKQGEFIRHPRTPRPAYDLNRAATAANDQLGIEFLQNQQKQKDAQLHAQERQILQSHPPPVGGVEAHLRNRQNPQAGQVAEQKQEKAIDIKARAKGRWRDLFRRQREQGQTFDTAERGFLSKLWSMAFVYRELRQQNRTADLSAGALAKADAMTIFYTLISSSQRRAVFDQAQENERRTLARYIRREVNMAAKDIDRAAAPDFDALRRQYLGQCGELRQTQQKQRADLKTAWQVRNDERKQALGPIRDRAARMKQARHYRRGRSIKDDDLYRRRLPKPDPGQGGPS